MIPLLLLLMIFQRFWNLWIRNHKEDQKYISYDKSQYHRYPTTNVIGSQEWENGSGWKNWGRHSRGPWHQKTSRTGGQRDKKMTCWTLVRVSCQVYLVWATQFSQLLKIENIFKWRSYTKASWFLTSLEKFGNPWLLHWGEVATFLKYIFGKNFLPVGLCSFCGMCSEGTQYLVILFLRVWSTGFRWWQPHPSIGNSPINLLPSGFIGHW